MVKLNLYSFGKKDSTQLMQKNYCHYKQLITTKMIVTYIKKSIATEKQCTLYAEIEFTAFFNPFVINPIMP